MKVKDVLRSGLCTDPTKSVPLLMTLLRNFSFRHLCSRGPHSCIHQRFLGDADDRISGKVATKSHKNSVSLSLLCQRGGKVDPFSFRGHVARVQSRTLETVHRSSAPQFNMTSCPSSRNCGGVGVWRLLCTTCLLSEFHFLISLNACNKFSIS